MANIIDICAGCGGKLEPFSLSREERIRRRVGGAMFVRCERCGVEVQVNKQAWMEFSREGRERSKRKRERAKITGQSTLF